MMENPWLIYFVSISENLHDALFALGIITTVVFACIGVFGAIVMGDSRTPDAECAAHCKRWVYKAMYVGFPLILLGVLIPTTDTLIKAYVMVEGSKIVNADNAEVAAKEVTARVDRVLDYLLKEEKPAQPGGPAEGTQ
jgi:hypothetical protein